MSDTATIEETETITRYAPKYNLVFINDDYHSMHFVTSVLMMVFGYDAQKSKNLMLEVHEKGRAIVYTNSLEVVELKRDQVQGIKQDEKKGPIGTEIEPCE